MTKTAVDQEFLEFVIKAIVNYPDDVKVVRSVDELGVLLTLKVHAEDMGQIIGKQGSTAKAIRTILRIIGVKNNARINLKIEEPAGSRRPERSESAPRTPADAPRTPAEKNVDEVVDELKL